MTTDHIALELCALSRVFKLSRGLFRAPGEIRAVDNVSLRIRRGQTLGLVGESGCGKSTLARMLLGLLPPLNPRRTVADIVAVPLRLHRVGSGAEQQRKVREMLDLVGMPERTHGQYPGQLSGGQRQRVAIARALVLRPGILVCDEPTSALDVSVQAQILNLLMDLKAEFGLTYLFISHDLGIVEHLADHVAVMHRGRIVELGTREQVFVQPAQPYTRRLLASVLSPEPGLGIPDIQEEEGVPDDPPVFHPAERLAS
jgi:peptide/nickel transport system ATP-binding protein